MAQLQHITHGIPPTYDERSRVLVLGTMPSPASRELGFNYGHPRNRFWSVMAELAGEPLPTTNERKRDFCLRHHIALWDVLAECDIEGASDASIRNPVPNPLTDITRSAPIEAVFCTGAKAYDLYNRHCAAEVGIPAVKLPSTSPANAACSREELLAAYAAIFEHEHPFAPPTLPVADVVALEQAIAAAGTPLAELMVRAGTAVAKRAHEMLQEVGDGIYPPWTDKADAHARWVHVREGSEGHPLVVVLCGNGNNGGDGWVAAAELARANVPVCLVAAKTPDMLSAQPAHDVAQEMLATLLDHGARVLRPGTPKPFDENGQVAHTPLVVIDDGTDEQHHHGVSEIIWRAHVVVDSMMGTGSSAKAPRQPFHDWIAQTNLKLAMHAILAVDIPSGVGANTGDSATPRILADETITMIVPKPGLSARECGRVSVAPLAYIEPFLEMEHFV